MKVQLRANPSSSSIRCMCTLDCLVVGLLFQVGLTWQLSLVNGSSDIRVILFSFSNMFVAYVESNFGRSRRLGWF